MKKTIHLLLTISLASILFAGCSGNLFMDMGLEKPPEFNANLTLSSSNVMDYIDTLDEVLLFPDSLSDSEVDEAYTNLTTYANNNPATEEGEAAAMAAAALKIESNDNAVALINNLASSISVLSDGDPTNDNAEDIIRSLIPEEVLGDKSVFEEMLLTLFDAALAFESLALDTEPTVEYSDAEKGDIAQYAVVSIVLKLAADSLGSDTTDDGFLDQDEMDALWDITQGGLTTIADNPFDELGSTTPSTNLTNILTWAGYGDFF